jgi:hypothetical protein
MLCAILWLDHVPKIAQSYVVNRLYELFSIYAESIQMIFVAKNK